MVKAKEALADALKYEGEVMGHCVGGSCPEVESGRSRIISLRDAKGEPHVTLEVGQPIKNFGADAETFLLMTTGMHEKILFALILQRRSLIGF